MEKITSNTRLPNYIKYFFILGSIMLSVYALIVIQFIFKPLMAAFILAVVLKPLCSQLKKFKISSALSAILSILLILIIITALTLFIFLQIKTITSDLPVLDEGFSLVINKTQEGLKKIFGITPTDQIDFLKKSSMSFLKSGTGFLQNFLSATADFFTEFFLFIIALFFFLYYRAFLLSFLFKCFSPHHHARVKITINSIEKIIRKYTLGLFLVVLTTGALNVIGLLALGLPHAFFFGALAGILTLVPYVGIIIGSIPPILFAIATMDSGWYPLGVIMIFGFVQFLEGNFITPNIIGNQVSLNPFASLLILFFSGIFLGILGVILALPMLAIIKIICDHVDSVKPVGYLLGNPDNL